MMKVMIIGGIILSIFSAYPAYSQYEDFSKAGGVEWKSYSDEVRLGFCLGFIAGVHKAIEELDIFIRQSSYQESTVEDKLPIYNITNAKLKESLDTFYSSNENENIPIKEAAIIVCAELTRNDKERIEKEKELLRLPPEEQRLVQRTDYLKEKIKRGEYDKFEVKDEKVVRKETGKVVPLESEEEIVDFWTEQVFPEESPRIKEVVRVDYTPAIVISAISVILAAGIILTAKRRRNDKKKR